VGHGGDTPYCLLGPPGTGDTVTIAAAAAAADADDDDDEGWEAVPTKREMDARRARRPKVSRFTHVEASRATGGDPPHCLLGPPAPGPYTTVIRKPVAPAPAPQEADAGPKNKPLQHKDLPDGQWECVLCGNVNRAYQQKKCNMKVGLGRKWVQNIIGKHST